MRHTLPLQDILSRPRRNRRSPAIRGAISETHISPANLILPVFLHDGEQNVPIASMPGVDRLGWRHGLLDAVAEARSVGVNSVVLFPKVGAPACAVQSTLAEPAPCNSDSPQARANSLACMCGLSSVPPLHCSGVFRAARAAVATCRSTGMSKGLDQLRSTMQRLYALSKGS